GPAASSPTQRRTGPHPNRLETTAARTLESRPPFVVKTGASDVQIPRETHTSSRPTAQLRLECPVFSINHSILVRPVRQIESRHPNLAHVLVALDAVQRQIDIGQRGPVQVLRLGFVNERLCRPAEIVAMQLV